MIAFTEVVDRVLIEDVAKVFHGAPPLCPVPNFAGIHCIRAWAPLLNSNEHESDRLALTRVTSSP
jgi:hypothetical protein